MSIAEAVTKTLLERSPPRTQEDCCAIAAKTAIVAAAAEGGMPLFGSELAHTARGLAQGLFGPAYIKADINQRERWVEMCKGALVTALNDLGIEPDMSC